MKKNVAKMVSLSLGLVMLVSGCSGGGQAPSSAPADTSTPKASNEPVTLIFFTAQNSVYADESGFENEIGQYIKKKFPNVTIQHIHKGKGQDYADLVAAGTIPDIVLESKSNILSRIKEFDLALDLSELIKNITSI